MSKAKLFKQIYTNHFNAQEWLDTVPREVNQAFFDNPHIELLYSTQTMLIKEAFGGWAEAVEWFLYEWGPGDIVKPSPDGPEIRIYNIDQYISYLNLYENFPA